MTADAGAAFPPDPAIPTVAPYSPVGARPLRWGLGDALVGYVIALFVEAFCVSAAAGLAGEDSLLTLGAGLIGLWLGLVGAVVYAARFKGSGSVVRDFGLRVKGAADVVGGAVIGLLSQYVLVTLIYLPIVWLSPELRKQIEEPAKNITNRANGPLAVTALFLLVAIGAPIVEELFFRGLLFRSFTRKWGPGWGIALSSLLFGLAHFELLQLPALVAFGVVLGLLAHRTGRLGPGIFAHMAFNAITVISLVSAH